MRLWYLVDVLALLVSSPVIVRCWHVARNWFKSTLQLFFLVLRSMDISFLSSPLIDRYQLLALNTLRFYSVRSVDVVLDLPRHQLGGFLCHRRYSSVNTSFCIGQYVHVCTLVPTAAVPSQNHLDQQLKEEVSKRQAWSSWSAEVHRRRI